MQPTTPEAQPQALAQPKVLEIEDLPREAFQADLKGRLRQARQTIEMSVQQRHPPFQRGR